MTAAINVLNLVASITGFVCWIIVLVKTFKDKEKNGVLHGILGIVTCGLWSLIWGWMHVTRLGIKKPMLIWTITIVINILVMILMMAMVGAGAGAGAVTHGM